MTRTQKALLVGAGVGVGLAARQIVRATRQPAFPGQVALVTGGSRGLGLEISRQLAREGCKLAICARDGEELDRARQDLEKRGAEVLAIECDISDPDQVSSMVSKAQHQFGAVDILVNNAGVIEVGPVESMELKDFEHAMNVIFWGTVYTTLELLPSFTSRRSGRIINISSIGGKVAVPHLLPYTCAKFAVAGFSEGLRSELLPKGISVTTVAPGLMRTGSVVDALFKGDQEKEARWFGIASFLPGVTMSTKRAACQIIDAAKAKQAEKILSKPANLLAKAHGLFPGALTDLMGAAAPYFLPKAKRTKWAKAGAALKFLQSPLMKAILTPSSKHLNQPAA